MNSKIQYNTQDGKIQFLHCTKKGQCCYIIQYYLPLQKPVLTRKTEMIDVRKPELKLVLTFTTPVSYSVLICWLWKFHTHYTSKALHAIRYTSTSNIYGIVIVLWQNKSSQKSLLYRYNLTTHRKPNFNKNYKYVYGLLGYAAT